MDFAYDHITEEALTPEERNQNKDKQPDATLNAEFQEAYKAISSSPWGAKLGGFFGSVVKQGESVYKEAQQEFNVVSEEATKGFTSLQSSIISRTRGLSIVQNKEGEKSGTATADKEGEASSSQKDLSTDEALKESEGVLARLKSEAAKRLVEIQKAEDAADEALLKFGTNISNFLKDAVKIAPPTETGEGQSNTVLFESKDSEGKRVIHTSRFDAQLHVIHSSIDSFMKDPVSEEFEPWTKTFNVEAKTDDISKDLEKYSELRVSMEKLVPGKVTYEEFFKRYYFLRHSIETAEARRRDLLKGAAASEQEEVKWDEDSEEEEESSSEEESEEEESDSDDEDDNATVKTNTKDTKRPGSAESSRTLHPTSTSQIPKQAKPDEPRKSNDEKSQADSDASYDVVGAASGAPSRAPNSPKELTEKKDDDSEEEDWE